MTSQVYFGFGVRARQVLAMQPGMAVLAEAEALFLQQEEILTKGQCEPRYGSIEYHSNILSDAREVENRDRDEIPRWRKGDWFASIPEPDLVRIGQVEKVLSPDLLAPYLLVRYTDFTDLGEEVSEEEICNASSLACRLTEEEISLAMNSLRWPSCCVLDLIALLGARWQRRATRDGRV